VGGGTKRRRGKKSRRHGVEIFQNRRRYPYQKGGGLFVGTPFQREIQKLKDLGEGALSSRGNYRVQYGRTLS